MTSRLRSVSIQKLATEGPLYLVRISSQAYINDRQLLFMPQNNISKNIGFVQNVRMTIRICRSPAVNNY